METPQDVAGGQTKSSDASLGEPSVAFRVMSRRPAERMQFPVDLNRELGGVAVEVEDIGPKRMLAPNAAAELVPAKRPPEQGLRQRHPPAKASRPRLCLLRRLQGRAPLPAYFASSSSMAPMRVGSWGSSRGEKRRATWPSLATRNFSKFQRMDPSGAARSPTPSAAGIALVSLA